MGIQPVNYASAALLILLSLYLSSHHQSIASADERLLKPWSKNAWYWTRHIKSRAAEVNKTVMVTEMWDDWNLQAERHRQTFDHPELYNYVDVSQNNHNTGQKHWNNFLFVREYLSKQPRPINTTKTYLILRALFSSLAFPTRRIGFLKPVLRKVSNRDGFGTKIESRES